MHALEILCSGLHGVAAILLGNVKSELAAILVTVWARAAQGSVQGGSPRAVLLTGRPGGRLWGPLACIDTQRLLVEVRPQGQAPPSVPVHHLEFSLCQLFLDVALWTSNRGYILRCPPDILKSLDPHAGSCGKSGDGFLIPCHCPCFGLSGKTYIAPITSHPWPRAWNETGALGHPRPYTPPPVFLT